MNELEVVTMKHQIAMITKLPKEVDGEPVSVVCVIVHGDKIETRARISSFEHAFTLSDALVEISNDLLLDVLKKVSNE